MNLSSDTSKALLALAYVEELSNKKKLALLEAVDSPLELTSDKLLVKKVLGEAHSKEFYDMIGRIDDIILRLEKENVRCVSFIDDDYPQLLSEIDDRPMLLFMKGNAAALNNDCIGVVGTRRPTRYGARVAEEFSRELARAGLTVVSGFARGVDGIAHRACVSEDKPTVAVFACGLDVCYPAEHKGLRDSILDKGGLIVSEYPLGTKPLQYHFPERNRIISGLSKGVLLAEAALKSGSLITMRLAIEQGRDIFVVPGNIYSPECAGSNALLREMPHSLVISPEDVLAAMNIRAVQHTEETVELSISENLVLDALHDGELHFEELMSATGLNVGELTNVLFSLQLNGLVDDIGSNYYALK